MFETIPRNTLSLGGLSRAGEMGAEHALAWGCDTAWGWVGLRTHVSLKTTVNPVVWNGQIPMLLI